MTFDAFPWRRCAAVVAAALGLSLGVALPATADPKGDPFEIQCGGLGSLQIVVNGNGSLTPGHVVGSTQVGIPYALRVEGTFTPVGGEPEPFLDEFARPAPSNQRLDFCTLHDEVSSEAGTLVVDGAVWISYTPSQ
jgi:hypothetical protein